MEDEWSANGESVVTDEEGNTVGRLIDDAVYDVEPAYNSIAVYEEGGQFEHLITQEFESSVHRGLHRSARESNETTPVFYNGLGWVDFGADFAQKLVDEFNLDITLRRDPSPWKPRKIKGVRK